MTLVVDASVVLRWFVAQEPAAEAAVTWLERLIDEPESLVGIDLLRFEVAGGLARLQRGRPDGWAERSFRRFERLGLRFLPTTLDLFERALRLSRELSLGGYDALYLAHAEDLDTAWLTADRRVLRRLRGDRRVTALA